MSEPTHSEIRSYIEEYCRMTNVIGGDDGTSYRGMRDGHLVLIAIKQQPFSGGYVAHAFSGGDMAMSEDRPYIELALKAIPWRNMEIFHVSG